MTKEMMSTKEVAEYLNINEKQVYKLIKERSIPATRITGKWTFPKKLVDDWIINNTNVHPGTKGAPRLEQHIVVMGSNDFSLELLSQELNHKHPEYSMSLSNVGSLEGLIALGRGICHMASCHLLDPETGTYNLTYIPKHIPEEEVTVINLAHRDVGLIIKKGNPLNISGIDDLQNPEIKIINRQKGSGTRTLLDRQLQQKGIAPEQVQGYEREVSTHAEAAIAVLGETADASVGILPAAKMLGLDFIHLTKERYDLVVPVKNLSAGPVKALLQILPSREFKEKIGRMGGYDTENTGQIMTG